MGLALAALGLSACLDGPANSSHFSGERFLFAADELTTFPYERDSHYGTRDFTVAVLSGDVVTGLGHRSVPNPFGWYPIEAVFVEAASSGQQATLELRYRDKPLDVAYVEFTREGAPALRNYPPLEELTASQDPLGEACALEGGSVVGSMTRVGADGRLLDSLFPFDTVMSADDFQVQAGNDGVGVSFVSFAAHVAGVYPLTVRSDETERTWVANVRVVRADELVTLELQTPTAHGLAPDTLLAVPRTADGCPVLGADITVEVDGVRVTRQSGWDAVDGSHAVTGTEVRVEWGELSATAVY